MPKGFIKVIYIVMGGIALTGCMSQIVAPFTFGPLLIVDGLILINDGMVGSFVHLSWHVLTWITYVQLVTLFLQFGAFYMVSELDKWEKGKKSDFQKHPLSVVICWVLIGLLVHVLLVYAITWLHFPAMRRIEAYQGVGLQMILVGGNFVLGLFVLIGVATDSGNRPRRSRRFYRPPRQRVWQRGLGKRKPVEQKVPRGRLSDGTVLPKPTQRPQRDPAFTRTEDDTNQANGRSRR